MSAARLGELALEGGKLFLLQRAVSRRAVGLAHDRPARAGFSHFRRGDSNACLVILQGGDTDRGQDPDRNDEQPRHDEKRGRATGSALAGKIR